MVTWVMESVRELNYGIWILTCVIGIVYELKCLIEFVDCLNWYTELWMVWSFELCIDLFVLESELNGWIGMWIIWNLFDWIMEWNGLIIKLYGNVLLIVCYFECFDQWINLGYDSNGNVMSIHVSKRS